VVFRSTREHWQKMCGDIAGVVTTSGTPGSASEKPGHASINLGVLVTSLGIAKDAHNKPASTLNCCRAVWEKHSPGVHCCCTWKL